MTLPFLERLRQGSLLADGAMGTMLHQTGAPIDTCFDLLNITDPARVASIHLDFVDAGAELIETNTFSANRFKLAGHNLADRLVEINTAAVELARRVVDALRKKHRRPVYIGGSVGPLGVRLAPYGRIQPEQAFEAFREQIATLAEAGIHVLVLETFTDLAEIIEAIKASRAVDPSLP